MSLSEVGESLSLPHDCSQPQTMSDQIAQVSAANHCFLTHSPPTVPEIRYAVPTQNYKYDPAVYRPQISSYNATAMLGPGTRIPVHCRELGHPCALGRQKLESCSLSCEGNRQPEYQRADIHPCRVIGCCGYITFYFPPLSSILSISSYSEGCTHIPP